MGSFNFGEPEVTDGVKSVYLCTCDENNEFCDCYELSEDYLKELEKKFGSICASIEYKINEEYSIYLQMDEAKVVRKSGYYRGVAFDYDSDYEVVITIFRNDGKKLPDLDKDGAYEEFEKMLEATDLPPHYMNDLLDIVWCGRDNITMFGTGLGESDKNFFDSILIGHSNAILPASESVGWVTSNYETEVNSPDVNEDASWSAYCNL